MNASKPGNLRPPALEIEGLQVGYSNGAGAVTALEIEHMSVPPGTLLAVTGPSGSGKSTFLYAIGGLLRPRRGRVLWDTRDILGETETARDRWRRHTVGFAFQDFHLLPELTPLQNVLLPASFERFTAARAVRERARALLDQLSVPQARASTASLSRGEQQRVAIARALLFDPPVILADEPTASLDAKAGAVVIDILMQLSSRDGRTVIAISHDQELLKQFARIVALDHGRMSDEERRAAS
ncbi:MAG TPA: ATP-binding cassette domain-containing protein [Xanthobacteraceae bacterium]